MRSWLRDNGWTVALGAGAVLLVYWLALGQWEWNDYDAEARPALDALLAGHVSRFFTLAPAYGGSLLIRAPFALVPKLWGGGELAVFRAAAAPCLAAAAALGVWLAAQVRRRGATHLTQGLLVLLCVVNPVTIAACQIGHPEELLGSVLCVAAVLAARGEQPTWAGVLLGLAIANKSWAAVAVGPVMLALPDRRLRALLSCGVVAASLLVPFALVSSTAFASQAQAASHTGTLFNPWQVWWFLGTHAHAVVGSTGAVRIGYRVAPGWVATVAHPLIVALTVPLTLLCVGLRRRGVRRPEHEALLLLMLLLLFRATLDPWNNDYYILPFLIATLTWEGLARGQPPALTLLCSLLAWFVTEGIPSSSLQLSPDMQALAFLLFAAPALLGMSAALFLPGLGERLANRLPGKLEPVATPS